MWHDTQLAFAKSLIDPDRIPPAETHGFNVYRNNVAVSLKTALGETFPVVKALVGEEFFDAMSGVFWRNFPPKSPVLAEWGEDFPAFIHSFEPAKVLPYLSDVAKLEWAWLKAYHSEDQAPVSMDILSQLGENGLEKNSLTLHPSFTLIASPWPIVSIWKAHQQDAPEINLSELMMHGENSFILRPALDVFVHEVDEAETTLIQSCLENCSISESLESISVFEDPAQVLISLFQRGGVVGIQPIHNK